MLRLVPEKTNFNFMRIHKTMTGISIAGMIITMVLLFTVGLNLGTDFSGGLLLEVQAQKAEDLSVLRKDLEKLDVGSVSIQEFGEKGRVLIRVGNPKGEDEASQKETIDAVKSVMGEDAIYRRVEFVGPQVGKELIQKGFIAVFLSCIGILGYLMMRFQWQFGFASVVALLHDTLLTIGLFCLTRAEFDLTTLAAVLMIAGYSINDTVVVFDRVREMMLKYRKMPMYELINLSINTTLSRTILTGGTSVLALIILYFFGGPVIQGFVGALIWGIIVGTYSSVFVAAPLLIYMGLRDGKEPKLEEAKA